MKGGRRLRHRGWFRGNDNGGYDSSSSCQRGLRIRDDKDGPPAQVSLNADIRGYVTSISVVESGQNGGVARIGPHRGRAGKGHFLRPGKRDRDRGYTHLHTAQWRARGARVPRPLGGAIREAAFTGRCGVLSRAGHRQRDMVLGTSPIGEVKDRHEQELLSIPGVIGVGISSRDGEPAIVVYLESDAPGACCRDPPGAGRFKVISEVTGP